MFLAFFGASRRSHLLPGLVISLLFHALLLSAGWLLEPAKLSMGRPLLRVRINEVHTVIRATSGEQVVPEIEVVASALALPKKAKGGAADTRRVASTSAVALPHAQSKSLAVIEKNERSSVSVETAEGVDGDALRQYRMALAIEMRRNPELSARAQAQGWSGRVGVIVHVMANSPAQTVLVKSSGHAPLDGLAQSMVMQAVGAVAIPEGLQGKRLDLPLLLDFGSTGD